MVMFRGLCGQVLVAVNGQGDWKLVSKESFPSAVSAFTAFIGSHIKNPVHSCVLANAHKCPCCFLCFPYFHGEEVGCHAKNVGALPHTHRLGDSKQQSTLRYICNKDVKRFIES